MPQSQSVRQNHNERSGITPSYLGIISSGGPNMDKHAKAQKAYAPCASTPWLPEMPPSKV